MASSALGSFPTPPVKAPTSATREGSYVGLTRARETTDIYAANALDPIPERDRLQELADHMSRTEPDLPSIRTPLAHETTLTKDVSVEAALPSQARTRDHEAEPTPHPRTTRNETTPISTWTPTARPRARAAAGASRKRSISTWSRRWTGTPSSVGPGRRPPTKLKPTERNGGCGLSARRWPRVWDDEAFSRGRDKGRERDPSFGLEP